jgi:hypothetical protein
MAFYHGHWQWLATFILSIASSVKGETVARVNVASIWQADTDSLRALADVSLHGRLETNEAYNLK